VRTYLLTKGRRIPIRNIDPRTPTAVPNTALADWTILPKLLILKDRTTQSVPYSTAAKLTNVELYKLPH